MARVPRIAIVSSGLGHVRRGNESGALAVAEALESSGADVTLFGGSPGVESVCRYIPVCNVRRDTPGLFRLLPWDRRYLVEQFTFEYFLRRHLRAERIDIVHAADPALALRLHRRAPELGIRVLYQNSQLLGPTWGAKFDFVQVLAPHYRNVAEEAGVDTSRWSVIPYLVDLERFRPADPAVSREARRRRGIPADATVLLAIGDLAPGSNKRLEWIVTEVAPLATRGRVHLVVLGQATANDLDSFRDFAGEALGASVQVAGNIDASQMADWYGVADAFVHAALREPFGIVFLEAMASGLPILAHPYAVTEWIVGPGGRLVDMTVAGDLRSAIEELIEKGDLRESLGRAARQRAIDTFSVERVVPQYREAYERMMEG